MGRVFDEKPGLACNLLHLCLTLFLLGALRSDGLPPSQHFFNSTAARQQPLFHHPRRYGVVLPPAERLYGACLVIEELSTILLEKVLLPKRLDRGHTFFLRSNCTPKNADSSSSTTERTSRLISNEYEALSPLTRANVSRLPKAAEGVVAHWARAHKYPIETFDCSQMSLRHREGFTRLFTSYVETNHKIRKSVPIQTVMAFVSGLTFHALNSEGDTQALSSELAKLTSYLYNHETQATGWESLHILNKQLQLGVGPENQDMLYQELCNVINDWEDAQDLSTSPSPGSHNPHIISSETPSKRSRTRIFFQNSPSSSRKKSISSSYSKLKKEMVEQAIKYDTGVNIYHSLDVALVMKTLVGDSQSTV